MISVTIDPKPLRHLRINQREFTNWMRPGFRQMLKALTEFSKHRHNWKRRTGKTDANTKFKLNRNGVSGKIYNDTDVAKFLYYGTKRHYVAPVRASALSWVQNGERRFSKGHFVSGIKPENWIEDNYKLREDRFLTLIENSVLDGMMKKWS